MSKAEQLKDLLHEFNVSHNGISYYEDPFKERYDIERGRGVTIGRIESLRREIASCLRLSDRVVEIKSNPKKSQRCISVVHHFVNRKIIRFADIVPNSNQGMSLPIVLGSDLNCNNHLYDLAKAPHLLIAGQTGSGKSIFLRGIIHSLLLFEHQADPVRFVIIDPKMEFAVYKQLPHILHWQRQIKNGFVYKREPCGYFSDVSRVNSMFDHVLYRINQRQEIFSQYQVSNIHQYKKIAVANKLEVMPRIVFIIDEFADLLKDNRSASEYIGAIARKARSAGVHLVAAIQRSSTDVINGSIKNNFVTRVAFKVGSRFDSEVILGNGNASKLVGNGDFIFQDNSKEERRLQAGYIDNIDVSEIVSKFN